MNSRIIKIRTKKLQAEYWDDGSGWIEILDKNGDQIYCTEAGTLSNQANDLQEWISIKESELKLLKVGSLKLQKLVVKYKNRK